MATIAIIGSGMMGSALAFPARENGNTVRLVGTPLDREIIDECRKTNRHPKFAKHFPNGIPPFPEGCEFYQIEEMTDAVKGADFVIGGVSSFGVDWFGEEVLPKLPPAMPVLSVTKGLMDTPDGKLLTYPAVWESRLAEKGISRTICAIGGPCTSYELVAHDQTEVAFCGKDIETLRMLKTAMATDYYHISLSTDVTGIESAVALKNGYALGIALTIGLNQRAFGIDSELHFNSQAAVFGQAVKEMKKLLDLQGAGTLENLCVGAGDLYVTVYGGRTRLVGILLGRGMSIDEAKAELKGVTLESLVVAVRVARAVKVLCSAGKLDAADFPLLMHTDEILTEKKPVSIPWEKFTFERA
ncbi:MAG: glycerol-3-phosphate dehydrogenase [Kiritimatiellae bacterium]|nr:glycerol-3-phosphate dehydrogenase [Kiritimatiellia bacterium]